LQKEELLHLHMLLIHIKKYYENTTGDDVLTGRYDSLLISPVHIHKNKISHKKAILTLGDELVEHIRAHQNSLINYHVETPSEKIAIE
jgi:hypothetical protein